MKFDFINFETYIFIEMGHFINLKQNNNKIYRDELVNYACIKKRITCFALIFQFTDIKLVQN